MKGRRAQAEPVETKPAESDAPRTGVSADRRTGAFAAVGTTAAPNRRRDKPRRNAGRGAVAETRAASVDELVRALASGLPPEDAAEAPEFDIDLEDEDGETEAPAAEAPIDEREAKRRSMPGVELQDSLPIDPDDDLSKIQGEASPRMMSIVESLLFASSKPLTVRDIRGLLKEPSKRQVQLALKQLILDTVQRGVMVVQVAGGFRMRTNPENARWVQQLVSGKPQRLSRSQLEVLAVIAYQQPITKPEIDHIRGVDCGAVLKVLLERDLAKIVGRKEEPGRPHLYGTTVKFLEFFNLRSLRDMPDLQEFGELTEESQATLREQLGEDLTAEREALGQETLEFGDDGPDGEDRAAGDGTLPDELEETEEFEEPDDDAEPAERRDADAEDDIDDAEADAVEASDEVDAEEDVEADEVDEVDDADVEDDEESDR